MERHTVFNEAPKNCTFLFIIGFFLKSAAVAGGCCNIAIGDMMWDYKGCLGGVGFGRSVRFITKQSPLIINMMARRSNYLTVAYLTDGGNEYSRVCLCSTLQFESSIRFRLDVRSRIRAVLYFTPRNVSLIDEVYSERIVKLNPAKST